MSLSSNERIADMEMVMTPKRFQQFMEMEKKKFAFNELLEKFQEKNEKIQKIIEKNKEKIVKNDDQLFHMYNSSITFTGHFCDILQEVNAQQEKALVLRKETNQLERETQCMIDDCWRKERKISYEYALITINTDLYENKLEEKKRTKQEATDLLWKRFLKRLNNLPDELLLVIQSYFTFETRAAILEKIHQPLKTLYSLKKDKLIRIVYRIYRKYCIKTKNCELREKTLELWDQLFGVHNLNENTWVSILTLKKLLAYWFLLFAKYNRHRYCYSIYAAATLMKKPIV